MVRTNDLKAPSSYEMLPGGDKRPNGLNNQPANDPQPRANSEIPMDSLPETNPPRELNHTENQIMHNLQQSGDMVGLKQGVREVAKQYLEDVSKGQVSKAHSALISLQDFELITVDHYGKKQEKSAPIIPSRMHSIRLTDRGKNYQIPQEFIDDLKDSES